MPQRSSNLRTIFFTYTLLGISLAGMLGAAALFYASGQYPDALLLVVLGALMMLISAISVRGSSRLLDKSDQTAYQRIRTHSHGYMICQNPARCRRCQGWWVGFSSTLIPVAVSVVFGASSITKAVSLPLLLAAGVILAFLTPIHGSYTAMKNLDQSHFLESDIFKFILGFLSALAIIILGIAMYRLL